MVINIKHTDYIYVNGKKLEAAWFGPSPTEAPTLIFLHEGLGCVELWRDFPAKLSEATGCGALVYSRLGYGRSDPCLLPRPVRFMHDEGLIVLPELIKTAGIKKCILIGHSDGGSVSIIYAGGTAALPLQGLITEAAHVFCEQISVKSIERAKETFLDGNLKENLEKYHGNNTDCAFWGWNGVWLHPDFLNWNLEEYLPKIRVPMLAIQGENDQYGTGAQINSIAEKAGKETKVLMLPDCRHSPHIEKEHQTLQAMTDFIFNITH